MQQLTPRRILVIESHLLGDVVMAIPALQALRQRYAGSHIALVSGPWAKELLEGQRLVDEFVEIRFPWSTYVYSPSNLRTVFSELVKLRKQPWDIGIDLRGDIRNIFFLYLTRAIRRVSYDFTGGEYLLSDVFHAPPELMHVIEFNAFLIQQLGCQSITRKPSLFVTDGEIKNARNILPRANDGEKKVVIGIHPGASKPLRHWKADRFAKLADLFLADHNNRVLLFQGPTDEAVVAKIVSLMNHVPTIITQPLRILPAILKCCDILVGLDSGAVHIAAAVGVPTVVLFGPAEPERVKPITDLTSIVIKEGYWCRPCDQVHCVQPENNCMDALDVLSVYSQVVQLLNKHAERKADS